MSLTIHQPSLPALTERAADYAARRVAPSTALAYTQDFNAFALWCSQHGLNALPALPETVGSYLAAHAEQHAVATLSRRLAAIVAAHRQAGLLLDTDGAAIRDVMAGIRRVEGAAQRRVEAARTDVVVQMIETCGDDLPGLRDRALLLLGFAAALRRSEIAALEVSDLAFERSGLRLTIRRSKTDQESVGQVVGVMSPGAIEAVRAWLAASGVTEGRVFRSIDRHGNVRDSMTDRSVALIVKARAEAAGLDPSQFSGHSLRAGFCTEAAARGAREIDIMRTTRHRSSRSLQGYIREASLFTNNASGKLGI